MSVEAGLSPLRVILREAARAIERARILHQRHNCFRTHGMEFLFLQHLCDEFARLAMAVFHRVNQRQRNFAFFQVAQHWLAQLLGGRREIQKIIY